jgi:hypothetical protein
MTQPPVVNIALHFLHYLFDFSVAECLKAHGHATGKHADVCSAARRVGNTNSRSASFDTTVREPVRGWRRLPLENTNPESISSLTQFVNAVHEKVKLLTKRPSERPKTSGVFLYAAHLTAAQLENAHGSKPTLDWGGFRDVGKRTNGTPLGTAWPLVQGVLRQLAGKV